MKHQKTLLAIAMISCAVTTSTAHASIVTLVTFSNEATQAVNTTITTPSPTSTKSSSSRHNSIEDYSKTESTSTVVITPPTTETPGLAYIYYDVTTKYKDSYTSYDNDHFNQYVTADAAQYAEGKWISISGTATSVAAAGLSFNLYASGKYKPTTTPFGASVPALPVFYFGSSLTDLSLVSGIVTDVDSTNSSYSTYTTTPWLSLAASTATDFFALVYALNDVSLSDFQLIATSSDYNEVTTLTPYEYTSHTLIGAEAIPSVPLPTATWLFMTGLLGVLYNGKKKSRAVA